MNAFLWMMMCLTLGLSLPAGAQPIRLVTLGDSLTAGDGDEPFQGGYPQRLLNLLLSDHAGSTLDNLAVSGQTTEDLINTQLGEAVELLNGAPTGNPKLALVWIGSNDLFGLYNSEVCAEWYGGDLDQCEEVEIGDALDRVGTILRTLGDTGAALYIALLDDQSRRPVLTDPSLREEYFPGITEEEIPRMSAQIQRYNQGVQTQAATYGATLVDFYSTTIFETPALLSSDGNHPNSSGYDQIATLWYEAINGTAPAPSACQVDSSLDAGDAVIFCPPVGDDGGNLISTISTSTQRLMPEDFQYLGAFRLPDDGNRPRTFAYGGNAMTFHPGGDPTGPADGFPGSLYISGHDRIAYGELPDGDQIAEISIPVPVISDRLEDLNQAVFLQGFQNVFSGWFTHLEEIPRLALQYLDHPATGPKLHGAWGAHYQSEPPTPRDASHFWFDPDLSDPQLQGAWYLDDLDPYRLNGYLLEIPAAWADAQVSGAYLGAGRFRDGGWGGMGPNLIAYRPWLDDAGTPPASGAVLDASVLLAYASSLDTEDVTYHSLQGYQHPDEWEGGAWITTSTGKSALLFAGTKGTGEKYWYGYRNPRGPEYPCVQDDFLGIACYLADGTPCPPEDLAHCCTEGLDCLGERGWWSSRFNARFLLYDPDQLAQVASGALEPWEPQPYAHLDFDEHLFLNPAGIEEDLLGTGVQRRYRIGEVAYDRAHDLLYVLELFADGAKPVVHVWRVR